MNANNRGYTPPDGGYGWVVLLACVVINSCLMPLTQCFGIIYDSKFVSMGISAAEISFLLHLNSSIMCSLGLFSGPLLKRFTFRQVALFGSSLVATGIFLTVFAESYSALIVTVSILIGAGHGILMPALYLAVNTYFKEKLTLAVSLQVTGVGLTPIVFPYFCIFLLNNFGTKGTVLMLSSIAFHALPLAVLLRPIKINRSELRVEAEESRRLYEGERENSENVQNLNDSNNHNTAPAYSNTVVYKETTKPKKQYKFLSEIYKIFNFNLLLDRTYLIIIIGMSISFASELNIVLMMPFILSEFAQFELVDVGLAMSIQCAADILGRLIIPMIAHETGCSTKLMYALALTFSSVGRTVLAIFHLNKSAVLTSAVILGLAKGTKAVFQSLIIPKYVAFENLAAATGLNMVANGIISLIVGPIIGFTHDVTNSYAITLHTATVLSMSCVALWIVDSFFKGSSDNKKIEERGILQNEGNCTHPSRPMR